MTNPEREQYLRIIEAQPSILDRFKDIQRLGQNGGEGNFSLVFKSHDEESGKEVALKFYNPLKIGDTYRERSFVREAEVLSRLVGQRDILQIVSDKAELVINLRDTRTNLLIPVRLPFFATELARANVLRYIYSDEPNPLKSLNIFRAMCRAVQRIHSLGICHRDLKPENFFRVRGELTKLGDFGTSRVLDGSMPPLLSNYAGWAGDKRYTAPEQCIDIPEKPSLFYLGDMYSLGAILFELFTKQLLFTIIYDEGFHQRLSQDFNYIPIDRRVSDFGNLVVYIAEGKQLPNIYDFDIDIPEGIKLRIDRLYKSLAYLDYRKRNISFQEVFGEIDRCIHVLENESKYRKMIKWKSNIQEVRKQKKRLGILISG